MNTIKTRVRSAPPGAQDPAPAVPAPPSGKVPFERERAMMLLHGMLRIRRMEEKSAELYGEGKIRGFLHLYIGEEAVAGGLLPALQEQDNVVATYREHGHALLRGVSMERIMAEMYGKVEGCARGRGGSMHLFDARVRLFGGNAIVGGGLPLATGLALAARQLDEPRVTACFFGEGAVAEGAFHEAMNLAALWQLPVLFCCENNLYAMGTALARSQARVDLCAKAASYGMQAASVDGMDVVAVHQAALAAVEQVRTGLSPVFLELRTYRFRAHSMFDAELYRDKAEVQAWKTRGPIHTYTARLKAQGLLTEPQFLALDRQVTEEVERAVAFAEAGHWEPVGDLLHDVVAAQAGGARSRSTRKSVPTEAGSAAGRVISYRDAMRAALHEALQRDTRVLLMGEDVGRYGGTYAVSKGLLAEFGPERIRDTPLSELGFVGAAIGAALGGLRPIVEVMTVNFSLLALDQIVNTAAVYRHMSGGQFNVPLVIRMATGAGRQLAAQHSHSLEAWYAHIPGIRVLAPATVEDARGMLWSALQDPDPVVIFEHAQLYNLEQALPVVPDADIAHARVRQSGTDVSLIAYGGSLHKTLDAARELATLGISAEVLDLRVLRPLDTGTLLASVRKTRRAVVVDEGWRSVGLAAEVMALIAEQAFFDLDAPPARVCSQEVPIPYARHMEEAALPQVATIVAAVRALLNR